MGHQPLPDEGGLATRSPPFPRLRYFSGDNLAVIFHFGNTDRTIFRHSWCMLQRIFPPNRCQLFEPVPTKRQSLFPSAQARQQLQKFEA
jgi:hypothetical protein